MAAVISLPSRQELDGQPCIGLRLVERRSRARAVAQALGGPNSGMRFVTGTGGETLPAGIDPKTVIVERSVPISTLEDALLAWEMNGEPLPHAHGGPLRLVIPGYSGVNNIKYIKRLAFTADQTDAAIQRTGYRMTPPGTKGDPSFPAVWEMPASAANQSLQQMDCW